jgi:glucokinase
MRVITVPYRNEYRLCASSASYALGIVQSKDNFSIGLDPGGTNLRAAKELAGIGVVVPGFILLKEGVIGNSNNLAALENFRIRDEMSRRLGTPVILENDANAAGLGEKWIGAGRTADDLVLLTLGTGIGGAVIANWKLVRGFLGMAGELGHITVAPNGNPCGCGNRGCVEKQSAAAVTALAKLLGLGDGLSWKEVYDLAPAGNENARTIFISMGEALGIALVTDLFAPAMIEEARRRSFTFRTTDTRIEKTELGNEAGLFGAAWLHWASD